LQFPLNRTVFALCILTLSSFVPALASPFLITPGSIWRDTQGNVIDAHGGGIIQVGPTYYWFGEVHGPGRQTAYVRCYSSNDLVHWKFESEALPAQATGDLGPHRVVERPKVIYNAATKMYVMYMHIDSENYAEAKAGVATSPTVTGPYTYLGSSRPLNRESRDMTLFQDADGSAYLVFEDRSKGGGVHIVQLSADYLNIAADIAILGGWVGHEAPAVVKIGGLYYLLGSHLSGWSTNDNEYATAPALAGPWSAFQPVAPKGTRTYNSQTAFILPVSGSLGTTYMYVGDRWHPDNLGDSRYIWLPLTLGPGSMYLPSDTAWYLDAQTGRASPIAP